MNPLSRISLPALRREILNVDTFFHKEPLPAHMSTQSNTEPGQVVVLSNTLFENARTSSVSSDEHYFFRSPADEHSSPPEEIPRAQDITACSSSSSGSSYGRVWISSSSGSGSDSDGPITPAHYPIDPAIEVPDLPEGEGIGQAYDDSGEIGSSASSPKKRRKSQLIRKAFMRIKALSR